MELVTESPFWYILICISLGLAYAFFLYYKDERLSSRIRKILFALRFFAISIIAFLLLTPMLRIIQREIEKPIVVIAQDNSESILVNKDSSFYKTQYPSLLNNAISKLSEFYTVKTYSFGDKIKNGINYSFKDKQTNISELLDEVHTRYSNRNLGAVVIASDGIYNKGSNPLYASAKIKAPIYCIGLGDTSISKDIILTRVNHNRIAYLGNNFPLEITIDAKLCGGNKTKLSVTKDDKTLYERNIDIANNSFSLRFPVYIEAKTKGVQHYRVSLSNVTGEISTSNNIKDVFIEVLESKQKILILAQAPHPDIGALKQTIENNQNYEVKTSFLENFNAVVNEYNLIILYQLPSKDDAALNIINKIKEQKIPVLFIVGAQTLMPAFNNLKTGVSITGSGNKTSEVQGIFAPDFSLFILSDKVIKSVAKYPPLLSPFGNYNVTSNIYTLFFQKISSVETEQPLLFFSENEGVRLGVLLGEGIWRWRLYDFILNNNHEATNEIITKIIQYLSVKEEKKQFKVISKNNYLENELINFDAELYNESYELINNPEVSLKIINKDKKVFPFTFSAAQKSYTLNAGYFPVGEYKYEASVKTGNKIYTEKGEFIVSPIQIESSQTIANHHILFMLSNKHGGELVFPAQLKQLADLLQQRQDIKTVSHSQKKLKELINLKLLFFIILLLIAGEWFLRKYNGAY